jgi:hypothetical protein
MMGRSRSYNFSVEVCSRSADGRDEAGLFVLSSSSDLGHPIMHLPDFCLVDPGNVATVTILLFLVLDDEPFIAKKT